MFYVSIAICVFLHREYSSCETADEWMGGWIGKGMKIYLRYLMYKTI